jgi:hypothetical protein
MSKSMPLFQRKRKKPDGETEEIMIGSHAVTLVVLVLVALLVSGLLILGIDPSALLHLVQRVPETLP